MKRLVMFCGCWLAYSACFAQGMDTADDINAIKRDTTYIYAESTRRDPVEAQSDARSFLELKVAEWVKSNYPKENVDTCVMKARENWLDLSSHRGDYSRVLVFVKKSTIIPIYLSSDEKKMAVIAGFDDIEPYITGLEKEGRINAYGKYDTLPKNVACYIFVYNQQRSVAAVLRQSKNGQYFNLRTKSSDNVRNYKNCGAIWFQLK